jgi:hypothetical protein
MQSINEQMYQQKVEESTSVKLGTKNENDVADSREKLRGISEDKK